MVAVWFAEHVVWLSVFELQVAECFDGVMVIEGCVEEAYLSSHS